MAKSKGEYSEIEELHRALNLYAAVSNFSIRLIKLGRKKTNPEHDHLYQDAATHINKAAEALRKITDRISQKMKGAHPGA